MALALCWALSASSCMMARPVREGLPPARHSVKLDGVVVYSDMKLSKNDSLLGELGELQHRVSEELRLPKSDREVAIYLFGDEARYRAYMQAKYPNLPARRAFFIGSAMELAVFAHWSDNVGKDLRHEYTHGLLHASLPYVPLWLDEGLAEYFEVSPADPMRINTEHAGQLVTSATNGWRPDLKRLEMIEDVSEMQRADYQEAWAWVHFLMHESPETREILLDYLHDLAGPGQTPPLSTRLAGVPVASEERFITYVSRLSGPRVWASVGE